MMVVMSKFARHAACQHEQLARRPILRFLSCCVVSLTAWVACCATAAAFPGPGGPVDCFRGRIRENVVTVETIRKVLQEGKSVELRDAAAAAAGEFGPDATELVPLLTVALERNDDFTRGVVVRALGEIGPAAAE
jgi:HEAT repeat protein